MKHYFYFKKGQPVPTWLFRPTSLDPNQWMMFTANGKVMVDDQTGQAFIWPTDPYYRSIIHSSGHAFDCGGPDFTNLMWAYRPLSIGSFKRKHKQKPLCGGVTYPQWSLPLQGYMRLGG